ncbi:Hypothetical protein CINCED_3A002429 [Cinara cedri]|uniref:Uncharacterized protein n=1 Tax=Cinara cedri TaxID=506608 RepID=A0A5E4ME19_9HEMI|nr:Hypothetical protein CINCED_3A002429 [Cinara cedri]
MGIDRDGPPRGTFVGTTDIEEGMSGLPGHTNCHREGYRKRFLFHVDWSVVSVALRVNRRGASEYGSRSGENRSIYIFLFSDAHTRGCETLALREGIENKKNKTKTSKFGGFGLSHIGCETRELV